MIYDEPVDVTYMVPKFNKDADDMEDADNEEEPETEGKEEDSKTEPALNVARIKHGDPALGIQRL